jgi:putative N6-adenine-specific DNA methylase
MLVAELAELGVPGARAGYLGVEADLTREDVYRVAYASRLASRILRPLAEFDCPDEDALYDNARELNWAAILKPGVTFKVSAAVADSTISHSQYAALKLKDAVVDAVRDARGNRPDVDRDDPDVLLHLLLHRDQAVISLCYSAPVMHRRGYRVHAVEAPLKENLAAAMLRLAKWDPWEKKEPLRDVFCGSGTILLEAAMLATRTPAGKLRARQGFEALPDFDAEIWARVKAEEDAKIVPLEPGLIAGWDIDAQAVTAARANIGRTPFAGKLAVERADFREVKGPFVDSVIAVNPPYGTRIGADGTSFRGANPLSSAASGTSGDAAAETLVAPGNDPALHKLYQDFGYFLKMQCAGSRACVLFPDPAYEKDVWFKPARGMWLDNGALSVRANVYEVKASAPRNDP